VLATGGPEKAPWAVLTLYAWGEDAERGRILAGAYAQPLLELARELGLPEPAAAAIFACTPDDPSDTTIQGFTEAVRCRGHWLQRLKLSGAKAVLVLDHKATLLARGPSAPVEWPAFRGKDWEIDGIPALSTHHPARMSRSPALREEVAADLRRILSLVGA
jgi:uracil-DNA glycosylase